MGEETFLYYEYNRQLSISVLLYDIEREKRSKQKVPGKEKRDMTTMNRMYYLNSESYESSLQYKSEWGFDFMRSYKDRQMRENVVLKRIQRR